ncbi:MAG: polyphosphate kinase 1, partial [Planctomycetes bacterium]|nr:polyphosphate kinase 1 [Planctomycetota bacterium]
MKPQASPSTSPKNPDASADKRSASAASRSATAAGQTPASLAHQPLGEFLNRELSWLEFNRRVLHEALDERTPLLERVAFLAIFTSNLDEWYQKRVGGMKRQIAAGVQTRSVDGLSAGEQIKLIRDAILPMIKTQAHAFLTQIKPALAEQGIHLLAWDELTESQRQTAKDYFHRNLFPVLTPLSVDPGHPFPFISNLSTSLGVLLRHPNEQAGVIEAEGDDAGTRFARVKVPAVLPRWVPLESDETVGAFRYIPLEDIIRHNLDQLFEGMNIEEIEPFRVTRNADVERDEEDAEDLLDLIEQELRDRRFAKVIRLETDDSPSLPINQFLIRELGLYAEDVYEMPGLLDYTPLWAINGINRPDLKHQPWTPVVPPRLADEDASIFSIIRQGDVLVHHPYESFASSVERFIRTAARDPDVVAIKLTLYRTAADSPFIPDLIKAAESGKQVVVLVELKARFDEQRNVHLAQQLEKHGIHVVYGLVGYKTHTKTSLVVRREADAMRCYAHVGTGNYHSKTANLYTDLGLLTADPRII